MHISQLTRKPDKGTPVQTQESLQLSREGGILGDCRSKGKQQISLWNSADQAAAAAMQPQGLCMKRFSANVIIDGLDTSTLHCGSKLLLGEVALLVTQTGKGCFPAECSLPGLDVRCPLQSCLYAEIETGGVLRLGDPVICLPSGE